MTTTDPTFAAYVAAQPGTVSDADVATAWNAQPPTPRAGPVYLTYLLLDPMPAPFGGNVAGNLRTGLLAWIAAPDLSLVNPTLPNPGRLANLHDRLAGSPGVDLADAATPGLLAVLSSGVDAAHPPLLSPAQSVALLAMGYVVNAPVAAVDVTAARAWVADQAARAKVITALASVLNDWLPGLASAPAAAAVSAQVSVSLAAAGVA